MAFNGTAPEGTGPVGTAAVEAIYRGYDRAGLEAQYNLRASHPDRDAVYEEYRLRSEAFRAAAGGRLDVPYGPAARQRLDVFPGATEDAPVFLFFHGGYWRALDKLYFEFMGEPFRRAGWATVFPNYTLAPDATMDTIVGQAREAVAWVRANLRGASRIVISGHSAGGHLTLMTILLDWARWDAAPPPVVAGIPISGLFDLEPLRHTTINDQVRMDRDGAARNSPFRLAGPCPTPLLVAVGGDETAEFQGQSLRFADAWRAVGNRAESYVAPGTNHFTVLRALADPDGPFQETLWSFLDSL